MNTQARAILLRDTNLANYRRARRWWWDYYRKGRGTYTAEERARFVADAVHYRARVSLLNTVLGQ